MISVAIRTKRSFAASGGGCPVLGLTSLGAFIDRLEADRHEVVMLFRDLLIGVTSFFRDEETFAALQHTVIPRLFEGKSPDTTIRIWVPGCATGEEAYSLAILMREQLDHLDGRAPKVQVFATNMTNRRSRRRGRDESGHTAARHVPPSGYHATSSTEWMAAIRSQNLSGSFAPSRRMASRAIRRSPASTKCPVETFSSILTWNCRAQSFLHSIKLSQRKQCCSAVPEPSRRHESLFKTLDRNRRIFQKRDITSPPLRMASQDSLRGRPDDERRQLAPAYFV